MALVERMKELLGERSGDARKSAASTLYTVRTNLSDSVGSLKFFSKEFSKSSDDLKQVFKAAHEMTDEELKTLKKLTEQLDKVKSKLKKYILLAAESIEAAGRIDLNKPGPRDRIGTEPPDEPFRPPR